MPKPSIQRLREAFSYDPETGELRWKISPRNGKAYIGDIAGTLDPRPGNNGRRAVALNQCLMPVHRVCWAIHHGEYPTHEIDHINGNASDNRLCNLRHVPHKDNLRNCKLSKNNSTGVNGVYRNKKGRTKAWRAMIQVDGRHIYLGAFDTVEEATAARRQADLRYGFHANHGKR